MTTLAIVQARTSSRRLPGKVLMEIGGTPMIIYQLKRISKARLVDKIVLATSADESDNELAELVSSSGYKVFRGDLHDVLERFRACAEEEECTRVVRLTGDCPLIDPVLIDDLIETYCNEDVDYLANCIDERALSVPDGFDAEVFSADLLKRAAKEACLGSEREHVTPWFRTKEAGIKWKHHRHTPVREFFRVTVDDENDLKVVRSIAEYFSAKGKEFGVDNVIDYLKANPRIAAINSSTARNEGYARSLANDLAAKGQKDACPGKGLELWERAKKVIPGGNMLLSKRAEMFLPGKWPSYFSRASGCRVWDLDNREYVDMSLMGVGTNLLGYGNAEVDDAVAAAVRAGNMSTLNCPEEVFLAEKLIDMHGWADMARFARSGGEANSIAIRIARAATGREVVAVCGYHGWHDWYLATNLANESGLEEHLLPGLEPRGVPKGLSGTVRPFSFNKIEQLEEITRSTELAAVKMEVQRNTQPNAGFLERIREICTKQGIVLIFDECTSGFRESFGGLHLKHNIAPDMAIFGKTLGNGYAISAVIGRREVMESAQETFISSTFWTERIGPTAALKTLEVMEREKTWDVVMDIGRRIRSGLKENGENSGLNISFSGLLPLTTFSFGTSNDALYKTYITQEMLKRGYLASTAIYACASHTNEHIKCYLEDMADIFVKIAEHQKEGGRMNILDGEICHQGFKRLN